MDPELERIKQEKLKKLMEKKPQGNAELEILVTDQDFNEKVIEQSKKVPVVVDFWATWCGPCVMLSPTLERLVKAYNGKFVLAKLNVDDNPYTSQMYMVMSIPSVKMFKGGKIVDEFVGALPEPAIRQWLDKNLNTTLS